MQKTIDRDKARLKTSIHEYKDELEEAGERRPQRAYTEAEMFEVMRKEHPLKYQLLLEFLLWVRQECDRFQIGYEGVRWWTHGQD